MMFQVEDWQTLQTLVNNVTITLNDQNTPTRAHNAIHSTIKDEQHFWNFRDMILNDLNWKTCRYTHTQQLHHYTNQQLQIYT